MKSRAALVEPGALATWPLVLSLLPVHVPEASGSAGQSVKSHLSGTRFKYYCVSYTVMATALTRTGLFKVSLAVTFVL